MAHTIEKAIESELFEHVVVSTDSEKISEIAKSFGAEVYHLIKNLQKVSGFLGSSDKPTPISDNEIKRILDESLENTRNILAMHRDLLETLATALLERETLNADEIKILNEGKTLAPLENEEEGSEEVSFSESADQDPAEADLLDPLDTAKEPSSVIEDESDEKITD